MAKKKTPNTKRNGEGLVFTSVLRSTSSSTLRKETQLFIYIILINSELSACSTTLKKLHKWSPDSMSYHGNREPEFFTSLKFEILRSYGKFEHVLGSSAKPLQLQKRETAWGNIAARVNASV